MFKLLLLLFAPIIAVLADIRISTADVSNGVLTVRWSSAVGDASVFSMQLIQADSLIQPFGVANNVPTEAGGLQLSLPSLPPASGYTVRFISTDNVGLIYAESQPFSVTEGDLTASVNPETFTLTYATSLRPGASTTSSSSSLAISTRSVSSATGTVTYIRASDTTTPAATSSSSAAAATTSASAGYKTHGSAALAILGSFLTVWVML